MARVFTTEFSFHSHWLRVLVVIKDNQEGLFIRIRVFDEEAIRILGKDSMEFVGLTGYKKLDEIQSSQALELLDSIYQAILDQLNKNP
jgi:hypothetical protein